jgi:hypothetical protein
VNRKKRPKLKTTKAEKPQANTRRSALILQRLSAEENRNAAELTASTGKPAQTATGGNGGTRSVRQCFHGQPENNAKFERVKTQMLFTPVVPMTIAARAYSR